MTIWRSLSLLALLTLFGCATSITGDDDDSAADDDDSQGDDDDSQADDDDDSQGDDDDSQGDDDDDDDTVSAGSLSFEPGTVDFGTLVVGEGTASRTVTATHTGGGPVTILSGSLIGSPGFNWFQPGSGLPHTINEGEASSFSIIFTPERALVGSSQLVLNLDDPANPTVRIDALVEVVAAAQ